MISHPRKAFLLAAGHGTRLRPLTDKVPKCLLPVRGIPMLQIWLERCQRFGVEEVLINLHSHADQVREFLQKNSSCNVRVQVSDEPVLLGSAGTVRANRSWVAHEQDFWIFYADVLSDIDLNRLLQRHREMRAEATVGVYRVPDPSRCGIVQVDDDGWVTEFIEKPTIPKGNLAFSGILLTTSKFLDTIPDRIPADIGFDVLPRITKLAAYEIDDYLIDVGTMENYRSAQENWRRANTHVTQEQNA